MRFMMLMIPMGYENAAAPVPCPNPRPLRR